MYVIGLFGSIGIQPQYFLVFTPISQTLNCRDSSKAAMSLLSSYRLTTSPNKPYLSASSHMLGWHQINRSDHNKANLAEVKSSQPTKGGSWAVRGSHLSLGREVLKDVGGVEGAGCEPRDSVSLLPWPQKSQGFVCVLDSTRGWLALTQHLPTLASGHAPLFN